MPRRGLAMRRTAPRQATLPPLATPRSLSHPRTGARLDLELRCRDCGLCTSRTRVVVWRGRLDADVLFVGEAPGADEDRLGRPFVGRSGKLLDRWIAELGLGDAWCITNVVRCRPEGNRKPRLAEAEACWKHLQAFVGFVRPKAVVAVGRTAQRFLERKGVPHLRLTHPSYYVRSGGRGWEPEVRRLRARLREALAGRGRVTVPAGGSEPASPS